MAKKVSKKSATKKSTSSKSPVETESTLDCPINLDDFDSIILKFSVSNNTSGTVIKESQAIQLIEFGERDLTLELPAKTCQKGHSLMVEIQPTQGVKKMAPFSASVKVGAVERLSDDADKVILDLVQYDQTGWSNFKGIYSGRQGEIENFLAAARGY